MAGVVDELKAKLAELDARLQAIKSEQVSLERDRQAFETVIACYDPNFRPSEMPAPKRRGSSDMLTPTKRAPHCSKVACCRFFGHRVRLIPPCFQTPSG